MTAKITASADGLSGSLAVGATEAFKFKPTGGGLELSQNGIPFQTVNSGGVVNFPQSPFATVAQVNATFVPLAGDVTISGTKTFVDIINIVHPGIWSVSQYMDAGGNFLIIGSGTSNGVLLPANANAWSPNNSDARLKKDFAPVYGLAEVLQIEPVKYRMATDEAGSTQRLGFTAQNLKPLIPEMVLDKADLAEDGTPYMTIIPDYILPVLVQAIKELTARVAELEAK